MGGPSVALGGAGEGGARVEGQDGHNAYSIIEMKYYAFCGYISRLAIGLRPAKPINV